MSRSDLDKIQGQLRQAIQSHQILVARMKSDPQNQLTQKQLHDLQSQITSLSEKQKIIVQQLRKELVPKPGNENVPALNQPPKPQTVSTDVSPSKPVLPVSTAPPTMTISQTKEYRRVGRPSSRRKDVRPSSPLRVPSYPVHRPSLLQTHKTNVLGDYTQSQNMSPPQPVKKMPDSERSVKENVKRSVVRRELPLGEKQKVEFMAALDLVTPDTVKELQTRRTERKRRTTANPHFACGNFESDRKTAFSNYLASIGMKRGRGRPPKMSPNTSRPGSPDSNDSGSYRNGYGRNGSFDGDIHEDFCAICRRSGQLLMCDTCSLVYHLQCLEPALIGVPQGLWSCPKCHVEGRQITPQQSQAWPATMEMVHSYIANKAAKEEEKRKLLKRKSDLQSEMLQLEIKSTQLNESINKQGEDKSKLQTMNNNTQASVDHIKKFIHVFQS